MHAIPISTAKILRRTEQQKWRYALLFLFRSANTSACEGAGEGEGGGGGGRRERGEGEAGRVKRVIALPLCTHRNYIIVFIVQAYSNSTLTT